MVSVVKQRCVVWGESAKHEMAGADLDHGFTGAGEAFVVLAVAASAAAPRVRPFHHPAFSHRREARRSCGARWNFDPPLGTLFGQPGTQGAVVVRVVSEQRDPARKSADATRDSN